MINISDAERRENLKAAAEQLIDAISRGDDPAALWVAERIVIVARQLPAKKAA